MAIAGLNETEFKRILRANLSPARAISDPEHLRGRQAKLKLIDRAFNSPGRHVFVFGDRGVGKTSLALTAAVMHQSSDNAPVRIACDRNATFFDLVKDIAKACIPPKEVVEKRRQSEGFSVRLPLFSYNNAQSIENGEIPDLRTINDAVQILKFVCDFHSKEPVVIIDEFDQIASESDKKSCADLIKQISDQDVSLRFIFCGIGSSLEELIGAHMSTGRYLAPVELERLSHDARWQIIDTAASALDIQVDRETNIRIGQISDGFPYYVHLIGECLFWTIFDEVEEISHCRLHDFDVGVKGALRDAETALKFAYDRATQKYSDDYQEVLWAMADGKILRRQISEVYEKSYIHIMKERPHRVKLEKQKFNNRLYNLAGERRGHVLQAMGAGWYQFRENVVRGYVRLRAEDQGVRLGIDHHYA